ncbi:Transcription factor SFP1 [Tolypocladium ophioglossoides CBS 100239]|uniref:Transcription factor SFP1 n=1 Tax=Tolypocladium ophioglossoides (strain CBS 100239) TaxID=1163406 RepID=A0A0L0NBM0_TOLOC|nr:Transcription factor SFP1 [Tolypocladium ophioglossoides CBS 100239]
MRSTLKWFQSAEQHREREEHHQRWSSTTSIAAAAAAATGPSASANKLGPSANHASSSATAWASTTKGASAAASDFAACSSATSASASVSVSASASTPASAHADSPASLINSTASLTQSPSPQPATPPDLFFPRSSKSVSTTATAPTTAFPPSRPISIATPPRDEAHSSSLNASNPFAFSDTDLADCDIVNMTTGALDVNGMGRSRQDSFVSAGPKPISMNNQNRENVNRNRRESLAGSLMGGVSWGGMSFGSFVRDDIMMQGTSPSPFGVPQSSSFHSSSYLPKLEANFMRDFTCCGKILPNLHDLLQHYEEAHTQPSPNASRNNAFSQFGQVGMQGAPPMSSSRTTPTPGQINTQPSDQLGQQRSVGSGFQMAGAQNAVGNGSQMNPVLATNMNDDMDTVGEMEMDDAIGTMELDDSNKMHQTRQMFGQQQRPQLNMNTSGLTQGLRTSQPPTPAAASFGLQHNPTVSSVNTRTLATQQQLPQQSQQAVGMGGMDEDLPGMPMGGANVTDIGDGNFANGNNESNFCINDPGKHLFSPNGAFPPGNRTIQQQLASLGLQQGQFADPEANKALLQRLHTMMMPEEHKPFKCPVIGCEKAYKNQNGLKYHKAHGHQTQQLHENGDGTFSIVNPETSAPYPGTLGMEKEKPFNCDTCGKRYKNLNGLKYHKSHSLPCNPEFKLQALAAGLNLPRVTEDQGMLQQ